MSEESRKRVLDEGKCSCREALADCAHAAWSGWMEYLFSKCYPETFSLYDPDTGALVIPAWAVERWKRQLETKYKDLPEKEKESAREEADKILLIINAHRESPTEKLTPQQIDNWRGLFGCMGAFLSDKEIEAARARMQGCLDETDKAHEETE